MSARSSVNIQPQSKPTRDDLIRIHELCTQFESNWATQAHTPAETLIAQSGIENRAALIESILRSELELRGYTPSLEQSETTSALELLNEFLRRFPDDSNSVRRAFLPVEVVEQVDQTLQTSADSNWHAIPPTLGPYKIIETFAQGGMGTIYRARHTQLDRIVALKVIRSGQLASETEIARFRNESQTIAALDHPHIVPIFDVGEADGFQYFSMPLLPGESLADRIREQPLSAQEAARLASQVASAVHFAHQHGVIHRDLKPRNVLIDATGNARVSDFGLAKHISGAFDSLGEDAANRAKSERDLTLTGEVVGTPSYMAPEQAAGKPTVASDVYAIGAVLYALLTGRPPFQAANVFEILRQVQEREPVEPRRLNSQIPRDLETITLKCLNKSPNLRYTSAEEIAQDLERFLRGQSISARPSTSLERTIRWIKRNPVTAGLSTAVVTSLAAGLALSTWYYSVARNQEQLASRNFDVALSTVNKYLTDVASSPELKSQGLEVLRRGLLENAREFYLQLERQSSDSLKLKGDIAEANFQLGNINKELGELDEADKYYQLSIDGWSEIANSNEKTTSVLLKLGRAYQQQSKALKQRPGDSKWEEASRKAIDQYRAASQLPNSTSASIGLASTLAEFAVDFGFTNRTDEEAEAFREVEAACIPLQSSLANYDVIDECIEGLHVFDHLALYKQQHGEVKDAEKWFLTSIELGESLRAKHPDNQQILHQLGRAHKNLCLVYAKNQRFSEAQTQSELAGEILKKLLVDHPLVIEYIDDYASLCINLVGQYALQGNFVAAESSFKEAHRLQSELIKRQPEVPKHHCALGLVCSNFGFNLLQSGRLDEAEAVLKEALASLDTAEKLDTNDLTVLWTKTLCNTNLGTVYRDQGLATQANVAYVAASKGFDSLLEKNPTVSQFQTNAVVCQINLAFSHRKIGDASATLAAVEKARSIIESLPSNISNSPDTNSFRANLLAVEAEVWMDENRLDEAEQNCVRSAEIFKQLIASSENAGRLQAQFGNALLDLSRIQLRRHQFDKALTTADQALEAFGIEMERRKGNSFKANQRIRESLCNAHLERARALLGLNRLEDAQNACQCALEFKTGNHASPVRALLSRLQIASGNAEAARSTLAEIDPTSKQSYECYIDQALTYAALSPDSPSKEYQAALDAAKRINSVRFEQERKELHLP